MIGCGLCGTDLFKVRHDTIEPGVVLGHELVGEVTEVGEGVETVATGERVVVPHHVSCGRCRLCLAGNEPLCATFSENLLDPGGFADFVRVGERAVREALYRFPDDTSSESAVFLEPAACVIRGIRRSNVLGNVEGSGSPARTGPGLRSASPGQAGGPTPTVAILGAGAMGLLHLFVLKAEDPSIRVIASDPIAERRSLAESLGADRATEPGEETRDAVEELSGGTGADAAFDTVGGSALLETSLALLRGGGTVVLFAHAGRDERSSFDLNALFKNEKNIVSTYSSSLRDQREAFDLIASGRLDPSPLVSHRVPLDRIDEAIALAENREAMKILIVPGER